MTTLEDLFRSEIRDPRTAIAIIAGILFVPLAVYWGWPVCAYAAVALVLMYALRHKQNVFAKAAVSLLKPITIGISLALLVAIYLNAAHTLGHTDAQALRQFEEWVLELAGRFSMVSKLPLLCLVALYLLLAAVAIRFPRLPLVDYVGTGRKYLGLAAGALTTLASVTFFSATAVDHRAETARSRITAQYRDSKEREAKLIAKYLALRTTAESLHALPRAEQHIYVRVFDFMHTYYGNDAVKVASLSGRGLWESTRGELYARPQHGEEEPKKEEAVNSYVELDTQLDQERRSEPARKAHLNQAQAALKKATTEVIGAGTGALRDIAFAWFASAAAGADADLIAEVKKYIGRGSEDWLEGQMKPYLDLAASDLRVRLQQLVKPSKSSVYDLPAFDSGGATMFERDTDKLISDTCKHGIDEVTHDPEMVVNRERARKRMDAALSAVAAVERPPFHEARLIPPATKEELEQARDGVTERPRDRIVDRIFDRGIHKRVEPPPHPGR